MKPALGAIRKSLDGLYLAGGALAALFMVAILVVIVWQMNARWWGFVAPGATDYAGYCMAGASFLALAYALNHGAHIRVSLFLTKMGRWRRVGELWCYTVATATAISPRTAGSSRWGSPATRARPAMSISLSKWPMLPTMALFFIAAICSARMIL